MAVLLPGCAFALLTVQLLKPDALAPLCCRYGLLQSIQHARWHFDVDINTFFPRAMNLSDAAELKAFEVDFKWSAAAAILRRVLHDGGTSSTGVPSQQHVHLAMQICSQQVWSMVTALCPLISPKSQLH